MPDSRRKHSSRRATLRVAALLATLVVCYVALVIHPQPLFAYSVQRANITLHARSPLPAEVLPQLDDALSRVSRSPLYDAARAHHVFLCDTPRLYSLFTLWNRNSGGMTVTWANGNVFIRPTNLQRGRVIGASGVEKAAPRTLAYYFAHEVAHAMTADHVGRAHFAHLAAFQVEGYADYVAFAEPVDIPRGRAALLANAFDMDPQRSGHYDRYRLLVAYLLQDRHVSVADLLREKRDRAALERELRAAK